MRRRQTSLIVTDFTGKGDMSNRDVIDVFYEYELEGMNTFAKGHPWRCGYLAALRDHKLINYDQWNKLVEISRQREKVIP